MLYYLFRCSLTLLLSFVLLSACTQEVDDSTEVKISALLSQMTLEEKVGQMTQLTLGAVCYPRVDTICGAEMRLDTDRLDSAILHYHVGSILNTGDCTMPRASWNRIIKKVQEVAVRRSRLHVPVLYGIDAIHGANYTDSATLFPQQLALAATWNTDFAATTGRITAYEVRASGIPWNFSPVLDVARNPLWSRTFETFGEDPYLAGMMGEAMVIGYQGDSLSSKYSVASCMKHFVGYSYSFSGKDRTPIYMSERMLRQYFLPSFQKAIESGAMTLMVNSSEINGLPVHADKHLLTELLKEELGFEGLVVTDWEDILKLHTVHHVASSYKEAIAMAINAGVDMSMTPYDLTFTKLLCELVNEGVVSMDRIDDAVKRVLRVKFKLGLFEHPYFEMDQYPDFGSDSFAAASYQAAQECITLLKNDDSILPLSRNSKVLVTGLAAHSLAPLNGAWTYTWQGGSMHHQRSAKKTIYQAMLDQVGNGKVIYSPGASYDSLVNIRDAIKAAKEVDYIVVCLGEFPGTERNADITELSFDQAQLAFARIMAETGKPVILVLAEARPRIITSIEPFMSAIVLAYLPGNEGGRAIADVLYGNVNPSGKLPLTYPKYSANLTTYDHKYSEALAYDNQKSGFDPLYEFGYGLSYTTFSYSDLKVSDDTISGSDTLVVSIKVSNTGQRTGKEVVQLYLRDHYASVTPEVKRLRGFSKIELQPGASKQVIFKLTQADFSFVSATNQTIVEPGVHSVLVSDLQQKFYLK